MSLVPGMVLQVPEGLWTHVGVYVGNGRVLHNHRDRGEELVTLQQFADGKNVKALLETVTDVTDFWQRVQQTLANPQSYNLVANNCEHTVSRVRTGVASSPQLSAILGIAISVGCAFLLAKAMK